MATLVWLRVDAVARAIEVFRAGVQAGYGQRAGLNALVRALLAIGHIRRAKQLQREVRKLNVRRGSAAR